MRKLWVSRNKMKIHPSSSSCKKKDQNRLKIFRRSSNNKIALLKLKRRMIISKKKSRTRIWTMNLNINSIHKRLLNRIKKLMKILKRAKRIQKKMMNNPTLTNLKMSILLILIVIFLCSKEKDF